MKNSILYAAVVVLCAVQWSCNLDNDYYYDTADNVYFDYQRDTSKMHIVYSFANTPSDVEYTVLLPVKVSGNRVDRDRVFNVEVDQSKSTAVSGTHFRPLDGSYTVAAGEGGFDLPVVLVNTDPAIEEETVTITIRLKPSEDFATGFPYLNTVDISFSNRLEKPEWWSWWEGEIGTYSRTRHYLFLISTGTTELPPASAEGGAMIALGYSRVFKAFVNDPFAWVELNPEFVIERVADEEGVPTYSFYLAERPEKTYKLQKIQINPAPALPTNVFFDEDGMMIYYM